MLMTFNMKQVDAVQLNQCSTNNTAGNKTYILEHTQ